MPTITQRGDTYRIRAYCGYDANGKQVTRSTTWKPAPGMTPRQIEKEVQRQAVLFEEKCSGQGCGGNVKFETFSRQWFQEYAVPTLRPRTVDMLHQLEGRTYAAIGHLRLDKLSARHMQGFINNLGEDGIASKATGVIRFLKLLACVFDVLKKHRADQAQERLLMGDQWQEGNRIFTSPYGEPMHPNTPYRWLSRFCADTGQRFLGVHQFRHLNATLLINSGVDVKTVSASLGHTQVSTTLNIYAHTFAEAQARAGEAVADALALGANRKAGTA